MPNDIKIVETDPDTIENSIIEAYESLTGRTLHRADPIRLFLLSIAQVVIQQRQLINRAVKQNLLYFAEDEMLDFMGYKWRTPRLEAKKAKTTMRLYFSAPQQSAVVIPKGIRFTADSQLFFITLEETIAQPESDYVDVIAESTEAGEIGNGLPPGRINVLVDPLPYVQSVENLTTTSGGADREDDESYRERIHQSPEKLSVAGPVGAYEYWAKTTSPLIADVVVDTPSPGTVDVRILLQNGELPGQELIDEVLKVLSDKTIRPLTDNVIVNAPDVVQYDLNLTYYIPSGDMHPETIKQNIEQAIHNYITWQKSKMGRDINPSKLISDCIKAGAKRVDVVSPTFAVIDKKELAVVGNVNIVFGGEEDE